MDIRMYQDTQRVDVAVGFDDVISKADSKRDRVRRFGAASSGLPRTEDLIRQARFWKRYLLVALHSFTFDRRFERLLFVPSRGAVREIELHFAPSEITGEVHSENVPVKSVKWALDILPAGEQSGTFIDGSAGRAQRLLIAAARPFEKIIGVEKSESLRDDARMNIAQFPRSYMRCRKVECLGAEPAEIPVPEGKAVYFFQKPRHIGDFQAQINRIVAEYKKNPRRFHILTLGASPQIDEIIMEAGVFEPASYSRLARIKHRIFSPYRIKAYKTFV